MTVSGYIYVIKVFKILSYNYLLNCIVKHQQQIILILNNLVDEKIENINKNTDDFVTRRVRSFGVGRGETSCCTVTWIIICLLQRSGSEKLF